MSTTTKAKRARNGVGSGELVRLLANANEAYKQAVQNYEDAEAEARSSFLEHNYASYMKGQRDAYRNLLHALLPNTKGE
jgi:predicted lipid-binding transport protein (Tim44 family)